MRLAKETTSYPDIAKGAGIVALFVGLAAINRPMADASTPEAKHDNATPLTLNIRENGNLNATTAPAAASDMPDTCGKPVAKTRECKIEYTCDNGESVLTLAFAQKAIITVSPDYAQPGKLAEEKKSFDTMTAEDRANIRAQGMKHLPVACVRLAELEPVCGR